MVYYAYMHTTTYTTPFTGTRGRRARLVPAGGFTLLELAVVLGLLSILGALAILNHQTIRARWHLSAAARQVTLDLKLMRMRAITRNVSHRLLFAAGSDRYRRQRQGGSVYLDDGPAVVLPRGIVVTDCTAASDAISFRPRGNAASFGTVTLQNVLGEVRHVIVDITGQVRME